jgi:hypothetical protein
MTKKLPYDKPRLVSFNMPVARGACSTGSNPGGSPPNQGCYNGVTALWICQTGIGAAGSRCLTGTTPQPPDVACYNGNRATLSCKNGNMARGSYCTNGNGFTP